MRPPMSPDDPRHGSTAGYSEHMRSDRKPCRPCREANNVRPSKGTNFIASGYDPRDALEGGRWMWDDRRAIRVWVVVDKPLAPEVVFTRTCHDCGTTVGKRFRYCESCGRERDRAVKRGYMRAKRGTEQDAVA